MKRKHSISKKVLVFSQWSRKKYAIFASLNKIVVIAKVSVDVCNSSLKKNISTTNFSNQINKFGEGFSTFLNDILDYIELGTSVLGNILFNLKHSLVLQISCNPEQQGPKNILQRNAHALIQIKHGLLCKLAVINSNLLENE